MRYSLENNKSYQSWRGYVMDKLKNNLASVAALIAAVVAIGGGFAKFG